MIGTIRSGIEYPLLSRKDVTYPDSDGLPMSDNTLQFQWITTLHFGFASLFENDPNVFVASDLLWYAQEGDPKVRLAPDVLLAFGRPKGHRGSYMQWLEDNIPPQVVIEVLSPSNRHPEMTRKHQFYEQHGVEEYYVFDPDPAEPTLQGYLRTGDVLRLLPEADGWISPRTGVKMTLEDGQLVCVGPDGKRFLTYFEMKAEAVEARIDAAEAKARAERLAAKLRELGIDTEDA
jgi:Uma2 family endonuclease